MSGGEPISYSEQISNSFSNFCFGIFLITLTTMAMWMIEQQAVKFAMILGRCQTACRIIKDISAVNTNYENRCILVKGQSSVHGDANITNTDTDTGFVADAQVKGNVVRQRRCVEMYQWKETEHRSKRKGHTDEVTYSYSLEWSAIYHDSSKFHQQGSPYQGNDHSGGGTTGGISYQDRTNQGHHNPPKNPNLDSTSKNADTYVGGYQLCKDQICLMEAFEKIDLSACPFEERNCKQYPTKPAVIQTRDDVSYLVYAPKGASNDCSLDNPEVGLVRISYECIYENGKVTALGVLTGKTFRAFTEDDAHATMGAGGLRQYFFCCNSKAGDEYNGVDDIESPLNRNNQGDDYGSDDEQPKRKSYNSGNCCDACGNVIPCCKLIGCLTPLLSKCVHSVVGDEVLLLEEKHSSMHAMFEHANAAFHFRLRLVRIACVLLFWLAVALIFDPISTLLSFIPLIGGLATSLLGLLTFILAMVLAGLIISVSWTIFHPEYLTVLLLGVGIPCWFSSTASHAWVIFGAYSTILSLIPLCLFIMNWIEECRFASEQDHLDQDIATKSSVLAAGTTTPLLKS